MLCCAVLCGRTHYPRTLIRLLATAVPPSCLPCARRPHGMAYMHPQQIRNKNDNTLLKYVETKPFSSQTGEPPAVTFTTVRNYDLLEVSKAMRGLATGIGMTLFMHLCVACRDHTA